MFCPTCGKNLPDDARFCDGCGNAIAAQAPAAAPAQSAYSAPAPSAPNPMVENFVASMKSFFSKNTVNTIGEASRSNTMEWLLIAGVNVLVYAIALAMNVWQLLGPAVDYDSDYLEDMGYNFFTWFGNGLLFALIAFFLLGLGVYLLVSAVCKKSVTFHQVFNMTALACVPLTVAYAANMLLGFLWFPLTTLISVMAIIPVVILLYGGVKKLLDGADATLGYSVVWGVVILVVSVVAFFVVAAAFADMASTFARSIF